MNPNNFKVVRLDGTTYDMNSLGIIINSLNIESPTPVHNREKIEGKDGFVDLGTEYDGRKIDAKCTMVAAGNTDFSLLRNQIFRIFDARESFYIRPDESPGKQILVKYDSPYSMSRRANLGEFSITLSSGSAYFESIFSALQSKNTSSFSIKNSGDKIINPREDALIITYTGASTNLKIKNNSTGDEWVYTGTSTAGDNIKLEGIRATKNGLSIFRNTNKKLITLAKGDNNFTLSGTSGAFTINFDFHDKYI